MSHFSLRLLPMVASLTLGVLQPAWAQSQAYPTKPVRVITPFAAGSVLDIGIRLVGEKFLAATGQPLIIENKAGGAGIIAAVAVAQAAPDGYTLLVGGTSLLAVNPHTYSSLPYDPAKSYRPITNLLGSPLVLAIHPSIPAKTLGEFVAYLKANPGKVSFGSMSAGTVSHFSGVLLNQRAGIDLLHVPFNGSAPATQNLIGGHVQAAIVPLISIKSNASAGLARVIAITSEKRSPAAPDVPTFEEQGFPDLTFYTWAAVMAPAGTPDNVVKILNQEFTRALRAEDVVAKFNAIDFTPLPSTPDEFAHYLRKDTERWGEAVRLSGFKATE